MKKKNIKKIITIITLILLLFTVSFEGYSSSTSFTVEAGSMKKLKAGQFKKKIEGGLNKKQTCDLLAYLSGPSMNAKTWNAHLKTGNYSMLFVIFKYRLGSEYVTGVGTRYNLKAVNKLLSSFTTFRYKKNKTYSSLLYTDGTFLYVLAGGTPNYNYIDMKSAKINSKKIEITYVLHNSMSEAAVKSSTGLGTYKAVFVKQKNKKYRLKSIRISG